MTDEPLWKDLNRPLSDLIETFGCDPKRFLPDEDSATLRYYIKLPFEEAAQALAIDQSTKEKKSDHLNQVFQALRDKYHGSVKFKITSGDWQVLSIDSYGQRELDDLFKKAAKRDELLLDLTIEKRELLEHWNLTAPHTDLKIYFYPDALARALGGPPTKLEKDKSLFKGFTGESKFIILVPDHNYLELNGEYLAVLGGAAVAEWRKYLPTQTPEQARLKVYSVREQLNTKPRWTHIDLKDLTPLQLLVDWPKPQQDEAQAPDRNDPIARTLFAQVIACSLLYMAGNSMSLEGKVANKSVSTSDDYPWIFTFAEDKYLVRIQVNNIEEIDRALIADGHQIPWKAAQQICRLASWIYSEERAVNNRLIVIQVVIASALQDNKPSDNLQELIRRAYDLHERVLRRWDAFIEEKLDKYFLNIKELEQTVDATTKSYNEQVDSLTKSLTDNMLAAVGVLVGTFIAAIFSSPFKISIFLVGAGIYLAYLIIFPIRIGLTTAWQRFQSSRAAFHSRRADFIKRLSQEEVSEIVKDTVRSAERRFIYWFRTTRERYKSVLITFASIMIIAVGLGVWQQLWPRKENFDVSGVFYRQPATSEVVPLLIQGSDFDKNKEIVITIGDSGFTNADDQTLKVHGSTAVIFSPRQEDLTKAKESGNGFILVKQGSSEPKKLSLPSHPAPIPYPVFEKWNLVAGGNGETVEALGLNFDSISQIGLSGAQLNFKVSDHGRTLKMSDLDPLEKLRLGGPLEVRLKNGERMQEIVPLALTKRAAEN